MKLLPIILLLGAATLATISSNLQAQPATPAPAKDTPLIRFGEPPVPPPTRGPFPEGKFQLEPNETVVFIGQGNFVREQKHGELEALLAKAHAVAKPHFRFMAWEGDTVYEQWRDLNFGSWKSQFEWAGASVIIAQFGQMEALDGPGKLEAFIAAYGKLLDQLVAQTKRIVLISAMPFENPASALIPDLTQHNPTVKLQAEAIRKLARERGAAFVDLSSVVPARKNQRLTENGIHLTDEGLRVVAQEIAGQLGARAEASGSQLSGLKATIIEKNRLWFDCWRPMNWAFAYGDRTHVEFGQPTQAGLPWLKEELQQFKTLLAESDAQIHALALGQPVTAKVPAAPEVPPATNLADSPEAEQATFKMRAGYSVNLFASEREGVIKPIQISWDERGRLWVACSPTYPHIEPGQKPRDFILRLEDTNGDGKADKSTRFAEGLHMVQGVEPGNGGIYVCAGTELVWFGDKNGDGRADEQRVVLSGFGTGDAHQLVNSVNHGPDGSLWFTQGLHIFSRIETPWGVSRLDCSGVWRFRPRTLRLDPFFNNATAGHNCWGVAADDYGQIFHKSGDRPDGYYTVPGMIRTTEPLEYHPRGALFQTPIKTTALDFAGTSHLPDEAQSAAVVAGFMANNVEMHRVLDDGSGFKTTLIPQVLKSSSRAFRPVDVSMGPDGAIYVADFYNPLIGHYQHSYRDPRRDRVHGRIWRISATDSPAAKAPRLATMRPAQLLEQLRSPERWTRLQAKRLLFWGESANVVKAADAWVARLKTKDPDRGRLLIDVSGVYQAHEVARPDLLVQLLASEDPRVRAYGTRVVGDWAEKLTAPLALLRRQANDEHPRVRLESVVAASQILSSEAMETALQVLDHPRDRFLDYALANCVRALKPYWQPALDARRFTTNSTHLAFLLEAAGPVAAEHSGATVYKHLCLNCHQPGGQGLPGVYPPLTNSEWVSGDKTTLIKMLIHGVSGPMTVGGKPFNNLMPPSGLSDRQIADVLTYARTNFNNTAGPVTVDEVKAVRGANRERRMFWTVEELSKVP